MSRFNLTNACLATLFISMSAQAQAQDIQALREHVNKGNFLMGRNQFQQAIDEYNAALDIDAGSQTAKENIVLAHNNWGIFLFHQHKYDEAKAEWDKALQMNPLDRNAKQNLAVLKQTLSRLTPPKPPAEKKGEEGGKDAAAKPGAETSGAAIISPTKSADENSTSAVMILSPTKSTTSTQKSAVIQPAAPAAAVKQDTPTAPAQPAYVDSPYGLPPGFKVVPPPPPPQNLYHPPAAVAAPVIAPAPVQSTNAPDYDDMKKESADSAPAANLDDELLAIEKKVYGKKKQKAMPMIQRVEKLETEICGKHNEGTLQQRIEILKKSAGL